MTTNDIRQRIGLDGGDDVKKQLNDLGDAGAAAFQKLQDAAAATKSLDDISPTLDAISAKAQELAPAFKEVGDSFAALGEAVVKSSAAIAAAVGGFTALVVATAKSEAALQQMSQAIGLTVDQFRALQFAFQSNGTGQDQFVSGISRFNKAIETANDTQTKFADAQDELQQKLALGQIGQRQYNTQLDALNQKAAQSTNVFQKLGVQIAHNADGTVDANQTLRNLADTFAAMPNGAEKSAAAIALFGRGNSAFIATLNGGSKGLDAYNAELLRIAPPLSEAAELAGGKLAQAFVKLEAAGNSLKNSAIAPFFEPLAQVINQVTEALVANCQSIIDVAQDLSTRVVPVFNSLGAVLTGVVLPALKQVNAAFNDVAGQINSVFGTNLTGTTLEAGFAITKLTGLFGVLTGSVRAVIAIVGVLAAIFGGAELAIGVALGAIGLAVGFFGAKFLETIGNIQGFWQNFWNSLPGFVTAPIEIILALFPGLGAAISGAFNDAVNVIKGIWGTAVADASAAATAISNGFSAAVQSVVGFVTSLPAQVTAAWQALVTLATNAWTDILAEANSIGQQIADVFNGVVAKIEGYWTDLKDTVLGILSSIQNAANAVGNAVSNAVSSASGANSGGQGFARGGMVRGGGSSTSDSIAARLSTGEFVQNARAVRFYGPDVMAAMNQLRAPVDLIRGAIRGIDLGGLGRSLMPQTNFATGGLVTAATTSVGASSGRTFNLVLGGEEFANLTGPENVLKGLEKFATRKSMRSTGRKPTWFR